MSKKLFTFLGRSENYVEMRYQLDKSLVSQSSSKFVQIALAETLCKNWSNNDTILVCTTAEVEKKDWPALKEEYEKKQNLPAIRNIPIADGKSEDELWKIFEAIVTATEENDEIYFDITNSFRSLPLLSFIVISYLRTIKSIKLGGILYGALEATGKQPRELKEIPITERPIVDMFNLTQFADLHDWTNAADRFIKSGDADGLKEITTYHDKEHARMLKGISPTKEMRHLVEALDEFSLSVKTNRLLNLADKKSAIDKRLSSLQNIKEVRRLKPLISVYDHINAKLSEFSTNDNIINGLAAVKWCIDHSLAQQGWTILQETLISQYCMIKNVNFSDVNRRTQLAHELSENGKDKKTATPLAELFYNLTDARNDINHAGCRPKAKEPKWFIKELKSKYEEACKIINGMKLPATQS